MLPVSCPYLKDNLSRPQGYKTFFMLNSIEHEILNAHKYKNINKIRLFLGSDKPRMLFFPLINVKMPTIVGILTLMSKKNFMLSWVEHEKRFITSGPDYCILHDSAKSKDQDLTAPMEQSELGLHSFGHTVYMLHKRGHYLNAWGNSRPNIYWQYGLEKFSEQVLWINSMIHHVKRRKHSLLQII